MTDLELLILRSISSDARIIAYRPRLRKIAGSVASTILLQQIVFRWENNDFQPFYKYKEPCAAHDYRRGDSWSEELGFSREEFDTALKHIGQKVKGSALRDYSQRDHDKLVWWWVMPDRKTWYEVNYVALCKAATPLYVGREPRFTSGGNPALPTLYTENTSENTTERGGEGDPPIIGDIGEQPTFTHPPRPLATPPKNRNRVTSSYYDPRKLVDGLIPAGKGATAVEVYFERYSPAAHKLTAPQQDDLARVVTDLDQWRAVVVAWDQAGNKAANIGGMLDWYRDPSRLPSNRHRPQATNGASKPAATATALADMKLKDWLLKFYTVNNLPTVIRMTGKTEKELRDEYKQWRVTNGLPPG